MQLFDRLFSCGAYAFNAGTVNLTAQPSYAGRVPGANYKGLEIWFEAVTAFTGNLSLAVTYTNQDGTTGRTTGTVAFGVAPGLGRMVRLPLQAGDTGVQKIESVTPSVSTAGTFNVHVMRRLGPAARVVANGVVVYDAFQLQWPVVYDTSALFLMVQADGTGSGLPYCNMNIANG
jgi:hypothetical protein